MFFFYKRLYYGSMICGDNNQVEVRMARYAALANLVVRLIIVHYSLHHKASNYTCYVPIYHVS